MKECKQCGVTKDTKKWNWSEFKMTEVDTGDTCGVCLNPFKEEPEHDGKWGSFYIPKEHSYELLGDIIRRSYFEETIAVNYEANRELHNLDNDTLPELYENTHQKKQAQTERDLLDQEVLESSVYRDLVLNADPEKYF